MRFPPLKPSSRIAAVSISRMYSARSRSIIHHLPHQTSQVQALHLNSRIYPPYTCNDVERSKTTGIINSRRPCFATLISPYPADVLAEQNFCFGGERRTLAA